ncbi:MAG: DNA polymerase Y family protein, partial [Pseudomonadota bacterium]
ADAAAMEKLAVWMVRLAPLVALDGRDGLMLDVTGCARVHGGEAAMVRLAGDLLARNRMPARVALAGTPGAAHALARAGVRTFLPTGDEQEGLADLPVAALRLTEDAQSLLRRFGLTRIGQLYAIDRKALARRFPSRAACDAVLLRLDQALGRRCEPLTPLAPTPAFAARLACPEPLADSQGVQAGLERLAHDLCADLKAAGRGARGLTLYAFRADGTCDAVAVSAARPVNDPAHALRLFRERIDRLNPGFGVDLLLLHALRPAAMEPGAPALSGALAGGDVDAEALAALADRVVAKLGEGAVTLAQPCDSRLPERAEKQTPFVDEALLHEARPTPQGPPRPVRLIEPPERVEAIALAPDGPPRRFRWRRVRHRVVKADGPERVSPEWWRRLPRPQTPDPAAPQQLQPGAAPLFPAEPVRPQKPLKRRWLQPKIDSRADAGHLVEIKSDLAALAAAQGADPSAEAAPAAPRRTRTRDYYRVEDDAGRRFWLFRAGLYDDEDARAPEWYVHGVFA